MSRDFRTWVYRLALDLSRGLLSCFVFRPYVIRHLLCIVVVLVFRWRGYRRYRSARYWVLRITFVGHMVCPARSLFAPPQRFTPLLDQSLPQKPFDF